MCPDRDQLTKLLSGDLPPPDWEEMRRHLHGCQSCRSLIPAVYEQTMGVEAGTAQEPEVDLAHYQVEDVHARGGLGVILRAYDKRLHRRVALKQMLASSPQLEARFRREALVTARLQHPSIVPVYEAGRWPSGQAFYVMKLVAGRTLASAIEAAHTLPERLALLSNVAQVADAVAYAHAEKIIHRDLKPANVMVGDFGETVVLDWGLAKSLDEHDDLGEGEAVGEATSAGAVLGTPRYMAPEQAAGQPVDARADVYGLGAILYELLAGGPPYAGVSSTAVLAKLLEGAPAELAQLAPGAPPDLLAIVRRAMARDPAARYPTGGELRDDLRRFLTGQLVSSHRYSTWQILRRFVARYRAPVGVALVALTALAALGTVSVRRIAAARDRAETQRNALLLAQARKAMAHDPTAALAWIKQYPLEGADWRAARSLISEAESAGVAQLVLRRTEPMARSPDGKWLAWCDDENIWLWDGSAHKLGRDHAVKTMSGSPDGKWLASLDRAGQLTLWEIASGRSRPLWHAPPGDYNSVNFFIWSEDARWLAAIGPRLTIWLWSAGDGAWRELKGHQADIDVISFSRDGKWLASGSTDKTVRLWSLPSGEARRFDGWKNTVDAVDFSRDGRTLAAGSYDGSVRLLPTGEGEPRTLGQHEGRVYGVAFSPDGRRLASTGADKTVRVWDLASGSFEDLRGHEQQVASLAWAPDSQRLASGSEDDTVRLWDLRSGLARVLRGHDSVILDLAFLGDHTLVSSSLDYVTRRWELPTIAPDRLRGAGQQVMHFAICGRWLVSGALDKLVRACALDSGECRDLPGHQAEVMFIACAPDGTHAASASYDGDARIWDLTSGSSRVLSAGAGPVRRVAFAADGTLVSLHQDGQLRRWLPGSDRPEVLMQLENNALTLTITADGKRVAAGGWDGRVYLWDQGVERRWLGHDNWIYTVLFSPDGELLLSTSADGTLRLWDRAGNARVLRGHTKPVPTAAFSPDGRLIASAGQDTTVRVWDTASGQSRVLLGHQAMVQRVVFSPDGRFLASGSDDRTVRVWDLATGESRVLIGHEASLRQIAFSADGKRLYSADRVGGVRRWPLDGPSVPSDPRQAAAWVARATTAVLEGDVAFTPVP